MAWFRFQGGRIINTAYIFEVAFVYLQDREMYEVTITLAPPVHWVEAKRDDTLSNITHPYREKIKVRGKDAERLLEYLMDTANGAFDVDGH